MWEPNQTNKQTFHGLQKYENKKARNESNKCNPYAGANNYHLTKQRQAAVCLSAQHELRLSWISFLLKALRLSPFGLVGVGFYRLWHPPSLHSGVFPTAVINCFALDEEAGSLPRLKLRTAYALFRSPGLRPSGNPLLELSLVRM